MRRLAAKKSRRRNSSEGPVSLFPFLAVLICTMGSLILLLVVIARQARLQASEQVGPDHQELLAEVDHELEMARLLASELDESHDATSGDLQKGRLELGQIEDHSGELRRQLAALEAAWKQLDQLESGKESARHAAESELVALAIEASQLEREVDLAKNKAGGREAAYSIVPYEGPHGTKRRPIYIECRADGLVLQPEGVTFGADDFDGPLDAGNPLDVGLRAVREYLTAQGSILGAEDTEPYPLLLVRPSGIAYFYAGRAAMKSWGTEFGYELIGDDWKLDFSQPDAVLAQVIVQAVEPARRRQRRLIAAAPSRYGGGSNRPVYTVNRYRGGVTSRGGSVGRDSDEPSPLSLRPSGSGSRFGNQYGSKPAGTALTGRFGNDLRGTGKTGEGALSRAGSGSGQPGDESGSPGEPSSSQPGQPGRSSPLGQPGGSSGSSGEQCENPSGESASPGQNSQAPQSLAKTRGRNWGLPDANHTAVSITRPIRVECHADRLVIVPERGLGQPKTISLPGATSASIDTFVSTVWDYMEGWGKAGRSMYWRPILHVYLGPGAESRIVELEALLQDSGLLVDYGGPLATTQ